MSLRPTAILFCFLAILLLASPGRAQTNAFSENFDAVTAPEPPVGWTLDPGWETFADAVSPGSGLNNLRHGGSTLASAATPVFDLTGATFATLTYLARRSASYDPGDLRVTASSDGGATFPTTLLAGGTAVPSADSKYESISVALPSALVGQASVAIRFEGLGLSSSSSNVRIDDVLVEAYADGATGGTVGFSAGPDTLVEGDTIDVPIALGFSAPPGLQGLQFRVSWQVDSLQLIDVARGPAVADPSAWSLSFEPSGTVVDVVLLGEGTTALASGTYDDLLILRLRAGSIDIEKSDLLVLSDVVSALATPEGTDAGIAAGNAAFGLTVSPGAAVFYSPAAQVPHVDVGSVQVGEIDSVVVTVSNPGGTTDLEIAGVTSSNPLFIIRPDSGRVAPDDSLHFTVSFAPVDTAFGLQEAQISFEHNGVDSLTVITVIGKGRGGRGDAEGDGTVDVLDVVHAIDFVLARTSPGPAQAAAADLFPFPDGDGVLDVRDLTVLSQAVARGQWPDGLLLPLEVGTSAKVVAGAVRVDLESTTTGGYRLELRHDLPVRGFQLILPAAVDPTSVTNVAVEGFAIRSAYDASRGELRIVGYVPSGGAARAATHHLMLSGAVGPPRYATAIGADGSRLAVQAGIPTLREREADPLQRLERPYPNPLRVDEAALRLPLLPPGSVVELFDVLGRRVRRMETGSARLVWDGHDAAGRPVAPGIYIVRAAADGAERTWTVVVLR